MEIATLPNVQLPLNHCLGMVFWELMAPVELGKSPLSKCMLGYIRIFIVIRSVPLAMWKVT